MDPVSVSGAIIAAVSAGAAAGATDMAKKAIADSYEGLKALIKKKFGGGDAAEAIGKLEAKPVSEGRRATVAEELKAVNADAEPELVSAARALLQLIQALPQGEKHIQAAQGIGIAQADRGSTATATVFSPPARKTDG